MNNPSFINSLNGIRGYAVLLVLLSHSSNEGRYLHEYLSFSGAGRYGVFLFFVLSAFLLTRQFLEANIKKTEVNGFLKHYFIRRFLRIFPLFGLALLVYCFLYKVGYGVYPIDEWVALKTLLLTEGIGIFWTIPVEFQYYFILPMVAFLLLKTKNLIATILVTALFSVIYWLIITPHYTSNLIPFLPIFVIGSVTAYVSHALKHHLENDQSAHVNVFNILAILFFLSFIVLTPLYFNTLFSANVDRTAFHLNFLLFSILGAGLVFFTMYGDGIIKRLMETKFMVFWGNISFSAYLWHMIILKLVEREMGFLSMQMQWVVFIVLTAAVSYASFRFFELPLSRLHKLKLINRMFKTKHADG